MSSVLGLRNHKENFREYVTSAGKVAEITKRILENV